MPVQVLFVDDETDFLDTLIKRMSKRKINVTGVKSGEAAVDFIKNMPTDQPIDVVILDVRMPGMDGIQTLKEIKETFKSVKHQVKDAIKELKKDFDL